MISVIRFDFAERTEEESRLSDIIEEKSDDIYFWVRVTRSGIASFVDFLQETFPASRPNRDLFDSRHSENIHLNHDFLSFALRETDYRGDELFTRRFHVLVAKRFMATLFPNDSRVQTEVLERYSEDFRKFAKSPGFLLFEIVDGLAAIYQRDFRQLHERIDRLQVELLREVDEEIFFSVSERTRHLLEFRRAVISARDILNTVSTRKSPFIPESTQPFLAQEADLLNRLGEDLSTQRAAITDTLNLYMGFVGYRTNRVINRLTVISLIFLPLTFLVGVYGMNFTHMPEIDWPYSYAVFWLIVLMIVCGLLYYFKRKRWLDN